jgi:hypothetical protein
MTGGEGSLKFETNPALLYAWARPGTVVVSQRIPAPGETNALAPLERNGIPLAHLATRGCPFSMELGSDHH